MAYEINIALNGTHFFATHDRSLSGCYEKQVREMFEDFKQRYPESEGFKVTITYYETRGTQLEW